MTASRGFVDVKWNFLPSHVVRHPYCLNNDRRTGPFDSYRVATIFGLQNYAAERLSMVQTSASEAASHTSSGRTVTLMSGFDFQHGISY